MRLISVRELGSESPWYSFGVTGYGRVWEFVQEEVERQERRHRQSNQSIAPSAQRGMGEIREREMDPKVKAKWIEALRSGEYEQYRGGLRKHDGYCCLGVLCKVMGAKFQRSSALSGNFEINGLLGTLPEYLIDRSGLDREAEARLVRMNDDDERSFAQIADYIEEHL